MTTRRTVVMTLGLAALAGPLAAFAQPKGKVWRVGFFYIGTRQSALETGRYEAFLQGMRELGYVEGKDFVVEARYAEGDTGRMPGLAAELVNARVDVIVSTATPMHQVLRKTAGAIPVVVTVSPDPLAEGLAKSLARPGGNFTGTANINVEVSQKYVELLASALPRLSRVGVLWTGTNPSHPPQLNTIRATAKARRLQVLDVETRSPGEIEHGLSGLSRSRADAVIVLGDGLFIQQVRQISELAVKYRLPTFFGTSEASELGGLMSYGTNARDNYRSAARFVDRIFKGAKPGDLPIEQPTRLELVVNLKTAKALGLAIPQEVLLRADRVIK